MLCDGEDSYVNITFPFAHPSACSATDTAAAAAPNAELNAKMELNKSIVVNMNNEFVVTNEHIMRTEIYHSK
jgi:hypothetical protein